LSNPLASASTLWDKAYGRLLSSIVPNDAFVKLFFSSLHLAARWATAIACGVLGVVVFLLPGLTLVSSLTNPALRNGDIPPLAWHLSRSLAPRYAKWAKARVEHKNNPHPVSGTEWPLFGSVFYLQAVEALQEEWIKDPRSSRVAPAIYSHDAIEAAVNLVVQPSQAEWVRQYWGGDYLHHADLFYRYLLISAMTSYTNLTENQRYTPQLRDQVESLSAELDRSRYGLLDDYPEQCYPPDVISALGAIQRADGVLHTDHRAFIKRALRGFSIPLIDPHGLPPYNVNVNTGALLQPSRGCGDSFDFIAASYLWPRQSAAWYNEYVAMFWQERNGLVGFREFASDTPPSMEFADVDSGPVIWNYGVAASAFGVGAAPPPGDKRRAAPLTAEMLVSSCPLVDGTLLIPRLLSDATDAPYLGEAGILFCLTRPVPTGTVPTTTVMTPLVWCALLAYFGLGILLLLPMILLAEKQYRKSSRISQGFGSGQDKRRTSAEPRVSSGRTR
jgi:hypothetical protein